RWFSPAIREHAVPVRPIADAGGFLRALVAAETPARSNHLAKLLRSWAQDPWLADTGRQALDLAQAMRPAVCLLNAQLPGLDGYAVAARMRQEADMEEAHLIGMTVA